VEQELDPAAKFVMAYWPGEGGAQPLRLGPDSALAVWESVEAAQRYAYSQRAQLQLVEVSGARLAAANEALVLNP
jgi:hypothetical protein